MPQNTKMLIGAVIAAALAFAVYYGLISQQQASSIQTQTNQSLGTTPASQQPAPQNTQNPPAQAPQNPPTQVPAPTGQVPPGQPPQQAPRQ